MVKYRQMVIVLLKKLIIKNQGFTLIEMLVSMSIMLTMTGLFLAGYHSNNQQADLNSAAQQLVSDIKLVENFALGAKKNDGSMPIGGWGIYLNNTSDNDKYLIYADDNPSNDHQYAGDTIYRTVKLPNGITIADNANNGLVVNNNSGNRLSLSFLAPDPTSFINRHSGSDSYDVLTHGEAKIKLVNKAGQSKTVLVNFFGMAQVLGN
jgi:prepilin-type N-terminal cleavage/methylation domain-containing protein